MENVNALTCESCNGALVVGRCAKIELHTDDHGRTLKTWWVCSVRCGYLLGLRHASELHELERIRLELGRRRRAPVPFRRRGGRS
jgi:hypothetical protein